jgi:hypothetical protein
MTSILGSTSTYTSTGSSSSSGSHVPNEASHLETNLYFALGTALVGAFIANAFDDAIL